MKKLTTKIMDNGKEKDIAVFLDDETAKVLEECGDEELKHRYIVEEYKDKLIERRETRRHQSLEVRFIVSIWKRSWQIQKSWYCCVWVIFTKLWARNARTVAEELDLTLTSREVGLPERVPMCGFPYYASDAYIEKILARHGVLLAEDGQEPKYILSHAEALQAEQAEISEEPEQESQSEIVERDEDEIAELQELFSEEEEEIKDPELIPIDDEPTPFDGRRGRAIRRGRGLRL